MHTIAPNLSALIGEMVGARLISHAGSLTNLAKYPASTVQILGAEKVRMFCFMGYLLLGPCLTERTVLLWASFCQPCFQRMQRLANRSRTVSCAGSNCTSVTTRWFQQDALTAVTRVAATYAHRCHFVLQRPRGLASRAEHQGQHASGCRKHAFVTSACAERTHSLLFSSVRPQALFRALKTKGNTPKYGLIFHSSFIGASLAS